MRFKPQPSHIPPPNPDWRYSEPNESKDGKSVWIEHRINELRRNAIVDLATGEQIYQAGLDGVEIIGSERYKNKVDPNQLPLTGLPETAGPLP